MPYYELRTKLAMQGKDPDQIAEGVQTFYAKGGLPKRDGVSFASMWSADQNLGSGIGHWHPHYGRNVADRLKCLSPSEKIV